MHRHEFRTQAQGRGFAAGLDFEVKLVTEGDADILYEAEEQWRTACIAGIELFMDYWSAGNRTLLSIRIHEISWFPADTNRLIVQFATVQALSAALEYPIPGLIFEPERCSFTFPDRRSLIQP